MESNADAENPSLVGQIVAQTLQALAPHDVFDADTLVRLNELAKSGNLSKYERIISALSAQEEK
jgi:hypothetical protein